jgi:hypothetical protein
VLSARVIHTDARFPFGFALETCLAVLLSPLCTYLLPCSHTLIFVLIRHLFSYFLLSQNTMVNAVMCWPNVEIRIRAIDAQYGSKGVFFCARGGGGTEKRDTSTTRPHSADHTLKVVTYTYERTFSPPGRRRDVK